MFCPYRYMRHLMRVRLRSVRRSRYRLRYRLRRRARGFGCIQRRPRGCCAVPTVSSLPIVRSFDRPFVHPFVAFVALTGALFGYGQFGVRRRIRIGAEVASVVM